MECAAPGYTQDHEWKAKVPSWRAGSGAVGRQHGAGDVVALRVCTGARAAGAAGRAQRRCADDLDGTSETHDPPLTQDTPVHDDPFMNEMDEISYWVYTKRAPCLMNYDNVIKKQHEATQKANLLNNKNKNVKVPSPKKKKRKLTLLDDDHVSVKKQQNLYFETSQQKQRTLPSSCKSDTVESDIDFNIKNISNQLKPKRVRKQKSSRTLHKQNKVVTSTPLRRSTRRTANGTSNNTQLNISFDTYNCSYLNGTTDQSNCKPDVKGRQRSGKKSLNKTQTTIERKVSVLPNRSKNETVQKEQFEDLSDVSGFTANYIRSTKLNSNTKPHRSLRSKNNRNLVKESQPAAQTGAEVPHRTTMLVCINKAVNASPQCPEAEVGVLNCSTDSSQNVINLVTTKNNDSNEKVNKSTSLLKFVDVKTSKPKESQSCEKGDNKLIGTTDLDISFQSRSTGNSRYPKRHKKNTETVTRSSNTLTRASLDKRRRADRDVVEFPDSERKENPDDATFSRTRSGRSLTLALRQPENSLIVYSNSTEKVSTVNTLNVASQAGQPQSKAKVKRVSQLKQAMDSSDLALHRDSVRERSGFAACFSDSDDDSDALKQRKFFC